MATKAKSYLPSGNHSVTPHVVVNNAAAAIEFYKKAFGAESVMPPFMMNGKIGHAELKIGDSLIYLNDEFPDSPCKAPTTVGGTTVTIHVYVPDVDKTWANATAAGAQAAMPLMDAFWGDRYGVLKDPFGHMWGLATHKEDVGPEEMAERAKAMFAHQ